MESGFEQPSTGGDKESEHGLLLPVAASCCLALLVLGILIFVSLSGGSDEVNAEDGDGGGGGEASSGEVTYSKHSPPAAKTARTSKKPSTRKAPTTPTMKPTMPTTTEATTTPSATTTPKKPPTTTKEPPTTTKKPPTTPKKPPTTTKKRPTTPKVATPTTTMPPELLCTVGDLAVLPAMYPTDGLCDYVFYTNVYIYNGQLTSTRVLRSFELFKATTKKYSKTEGGVSFDIRYIESTTLASRRQALTGLSAYRIQHYGCLTMIAPTPTLEHWVKKAKDIFGVSGSA
ncbi:uncharacterized protein LOC142588867 [Dermacentor variabilis]|uniref:uncharacterized protein LOC142588867 n=1 Tax=Dermacentor variabilis TaxID=34621 RepID=UPI003F5AE130